ncbi:MAG: type II toxin-antitoxin system RelE/ParE family toxin [Rhodocyclales bacterium]|nr:type II toxin-antitoxin system RelE/ParE family toxin [Rhodocyclales bacterium]
MPRRAKPPVVKLTANFERNLADIERFLAEAEAPQAFDALLDELMDTVIPNLERFPGMGRPFLRRPTHSVEAANAVDALAAPLAALTADRDALREYVLKHYLLLYAAMGNTIHLLAIRHQRQLSFNFEKLWTD